MSGQIPDGVPNQPPEDHRVYLPQPATGAAVTGLVVSVMAEEVLPPETPKVTPDTEATPAPEDEVLLAWFA